MKKALIITDLQSKHDDYSPKYVQLINDLAKSAREKNYPVIWTRFVGQDWEVELYGQRAPISGEAGFEIAEGFEVADGDVVVDKNGYNALSNKQLSMILSDKGVETIVLVGRSTGVCILATAYGALEKGLKVEVIKAGLIDGSKEKNGEGLSLLLAYSAKEIYYL